MSDKWELLLELLEVSLEKNGDKPITIKHLISMMKMVDGMVEFEESDYVEDTDGSESTDWMWK